MKIPFLLPEIVLLALQLIAAQAQEIKEPEPQDQFFFLDSVGDIRPLERQLPNGMVVQGDRSPFRLVQAEPSAFVVRLSPLTADPATIIQLFQLRPLNKNRTFENLKHSRSIPFNVTKYGENSYRINAKEKLGPGEYALKLSTNKDAYCFAVDAASKTLN